MCVLVLLASCGTSCRGGEQPDRSGDGPDQVAPEDAARLFVASARRCGECHGPMEEQWRTSAHASSHRSPAYRAMKAQAGEDTCARCHEPLAGLVDPRQPGASEGVTCDVCHAISEVTIGELHGTYTLRLDDNTKYGPICDAQDHYFHKMGCAPFFQDPEYCGACHMWRRELPSGETLPVYTEYEEWEQGPYADAGMVCQQCHMPTRVAEVAKGSPPRSGVSHHGFLGEAGDLRRRALSLRVEGQGGGGAVALAITVRNSGAGHSVPTGFPGRRILLQLRTFDEAGSETDRAEIEYGRILVDDAGDEVPFHRAVRVGSDRRLPPRRDVVERLALRAAPGGHLEIRLVWLRLSPALAAALGVDSPDQETLLEERVPLRGAFASGAAAPLLVHEARTTR